MARPGNPMTLTRDVTQSGPIWIQLMGGLGNQMFQYAFGYSLAQRRKAPLVLDTRYFNLSRMLPRVTRRSFSLDPYRIQAHVFRGSDPRGLNVSQVPRPVLLPRWHRRAQEISDRLRNVQNRQFPTYFERQVTFDASMIEQGSTGGQFIGYWQSPLYFKGHIESLRRDLTVDPASIPPPVSDLASRISRASGICLNVRRGDFAESARNRNFHGLLTLDYYLTGLEFAREKLGNRPVYVFSDDIPWCRENLKQPGIQIVEHDLAGPQFSWYLYLMSQCSAFVIPNSSFAWWATRLARVPTELVVAPAYWTSNQKTTDTDLPGEDWTLL